MWKNLGAGQWRESAATEETSGKREDPLKMTSLPPIAGVLIALGIGPALADPVADFYSGKTVTLVVPFSPGGSTATQAQIAGDYFGKYIPGNPTIHLEFMPGGGGMVALNHSYASSPRDGTVIIYAQDSNVVQQPLNPEVQYDVRELNWLGSMVEFDYVLAVSKASGVATLADMQGKELFTGATGVGSQSYIFPSLVNYLFDTDMNIIPSYESAELLLALESGELDAYVTPYWFSNLHIYEKFNPVMTFGPERSRKFPDVPTLLELVETPEDKALVQFIGLIGSLGRGFATMPDVPQERVAALRQAFLDMAADPGFIEAMKRVGTGEEVRDAPMSGEELQQRIIAGLDIDESVIERARLSTQPQE